ncbi:MAG: hypothetical protein F4Y94_02030 [Chloroflexi bacterium]|nr:hypothetical protein [Chloroflexota bacterium]
MTKRRWNLRDMPGPPGSVVTFDLTSWERPTATTIIGIVCAVARFAHAGHTLRIVWPRSNYALRLLSTVELVEALETFASVRGSRAEGRVQRHHPIIPVTNIKAARDVDELGANVEEEFTASGRFAANLLGDVYICMTEAANNVVQHSRSPVGGFAMAQGRYFKAFGELRPYIEIAVGDPGVGIAESLGIASDREAIAEAMKEGVSSTATANRGLGLYVIEAAAKNGLHRFVALHSGEGHVIRGSSVEATDREVGCTSGGTWLTVLLPY